MTKEESLALCNSCQEEIMGRFPTNDYHYVTKIVSKDGIEVLKCCDVCNKDRKSTIRQTAWSSHP